MIYTIFEDKNDESLFPFNLNHASFELRCGAFSNFERIQMLLKEQDSVELIVRDELAPLIRERYPDITVNPDIVSSGIWLNGRAIWSQEALHNIESFRTYKKGDRLIAHHKKDDLSIDEMDSYMETIGLVTTEIELECFNNIWDGIFFQSNIIIKDAEHFMELNQGDVHQSVAIVNGDNIFINNNVQVCANAVLDASKGPIIIAQGATIEIGALIKGPIYIGPNCLVNPGAKLNGNISFGPMCKIGGEVEDVIIQGYSNKQHDGFLGHSYIGEWNNLGANTNNSDLKNNYSNVRLIIKNKIVDTEKIFLGVIMGDYSRTGISTMLNTGTVIGLGANIFGADFQEKYIASFQWGRENKTKLDKFLQTIERMKARRNKTITQEEKNFLSNLYDKNI